MGIIEIIMIVLLCLTTGLLIWLLIGQVKKSNYGKAVAISILIALLLLAWVELGVGIFGTPFAGN